MGRYSSQMGKKIRLGILFGGRSCEHEVSVLSAGSMVQRLDREKYEVTLIGIAKDGRWLLSTDSDTLPEKFFIEGNDLVPVLLDYCETQTLFAHEIPSAGSQVGIITQLDVVFPLLHGPFGEDGTIQGLLELAGVPYVGSGVVGSAIGMDKVMMKRVFRAEGLPILPYIEASQTQLMQDLDALERRAHRELGYPLFVKPASLGSSVGVHRVNETSDFAEAVLDAAQFDHKIVVEKAAAGAREIECAVLGNDTPKASVLGEVLPSEGFYDYASKYVNEDAALIIPATLPPRLAAHIQALALDVFQAVDAKGLARVDFFVREDGEEVVVNEINTMPGFTPISMYPKLWEASNLPYRNLVDRLIELALEHHRDTSRIRRAL